MCAGWLVCADGELGDLSAIQAKEDDAAIAAAAAEQAAGAPVAAPKAKGIVKVAGRRKIRPPPKIPEAANATGGGAGAL